MTIALDQNMFHGTLAMSATMSENLPHNNIMVTAVMHDRRTILCLKQPFQLSGTAGTIIVTHFSSDKKIGIHTIRTHNTSASTTGHKLFQSLMF